MLGVHIDNIMHVVYEASKEEDILLLVDKIAEEIEWKYKIDYKDDVKHRHYFANYPICFDTECSSFYHDLKGHFHTNEEVENILENAYNEAYQKEYKKSKSKKKAKNKGILAQAQAKENYKPRATMYIWQMAFGINDTVIIGRTMDELVDVLNVLKDAFGLNDMKEFVIYVHNLKYDFSFLKRNFTWNNEKSLLNDKVIYYASTDGLNYSDPDMPRGIGWMDFSGFLFKDSLALAAVKLENINEVMTTYSNKIHKQKGSLDYKKVRHSKTPLTEEELGYCIADVLVLNYFIQEKLESNNYNITRIPLTKTGEVRRACRDRLFYKNPKVKTKKDDQYKNYMTFLDNMKFDVAVYQQIKRAFQGGYTHANRIHVGEIVESDGISGGIYSVDIKSSYPAVMVMEKFPMTPYEKVSIKSKKDFNYYIENKACLFDVTLYDVRPKMTDEVDFDLIDNIISTYKLEQFGKLYPDCKPIYPPDGEMEEENKWYKNNGRLRYAERITLTVNEIDWKSICMFYDFDKDKVHVNNFRIAEKNYLPKPLIEYILELFFNKEEEDHNSLAYKIAKVFINSLYGMVATDIIQEHYILDNEDNLNIKRQYENLTQEELIELQEEELEKKAGFLCYQWSHALTSYARHNLFRIIAASGENHYYSDTDSEKFYMPPHSVTCKTLNFIRDYNAEVDYKMNECFRYYHILDNMHITPNGSALGHFELENKRKPYKKFCCVGAKRYLYEDEKGTTITVAGLDKESISYLQEKYGDKLFEVFAKSEIEVDREHSGRTIATYINDTTKGEIIDYLDNKSTFGEMSSVHIENAPFTMNACEDYDHILSIGEIEGWRGI